MQTNAYWQFMLLGVFFLLLGNVLSVTEDDQLLGWNKAHGLWGKRSAAPEFFNKQEKRPEDWTKLNTLWGKRSVIPAYEAYAEWNKRAQWQMANGLWGR